MTDPTSPSDDGVHVCPSCGTANEPDDLFCGGCGRVARVPPAAAARRARGPGTRRLPAGRPWPAPRSAGRPTSCPSCGLPNPPGRTFCQRCGWELHRAATGPPGPPLEPLVGRASGGATPRRAPLPPPRPGAAGGGRPRVGRWLPRPDVPGRPRRWRRGRAPGRDVLPRGQHRSVPDQPRARYLAEPGASPAPHIAPSPTRTPTSSPSPSLPSTPLRRRPPRHRPDTHPDA